MNNLIARIKKDFKKHWELNDPAHREKHFNDVYATAVVINKMCKLGYTEKHIIVAAYFHDLFAWERDVHHILGAEYILITTYPIIAEHSKEERKMISAAVREHRASYEGQYSTRFSELIAAADRGMPGNVIEMYERSFAYTQAKHPELSREEIIAISIKHISEKFGHKGYAKYPPLYEEAFGDELFQQREEIKEIERKFAEGCIVWK